eukprot:TRINITY_DN28115_c0_g1_i1.p1 TRINITY_DN28115_c0_g1~~TRINITY_DN28115_c0_g1_i1.p1  ORF type:complete len:740 (+),score=141.06 TRINITY_DN28115_c0_g1_i1:50-2269(+)
MPKSWRPFPLCLDVFFAWNFFPLFAFLVTASLRILVELKYSVKPAPAAALLVVLGGWGVNATLGMFTTMLFEVLDVFGDDPTSRFKHRAVQRKIEFLVANGQNPLTSLTPAVAAIAGAASCTSEHSDAVMAALGVLGMQVVAVLIAYRRAHVQHGRGRALSSQSTWRLPTLKKVELCVRDPVWWNKMVDRTRDSAVGGCLALSLFLGCSRGGCTGGFVGLEHFLTVSTFLALSHFALWLALHVAYIIRCPSVHFSAKARLVGLGCAAAVAAVTHLLHGRKFVTGFAGYSALWTLAVCALRTAAAYRTEEPSTVPTLQLPPKSRRVAKAVERSRTPSPLPEPSGRQLSPRIVARELALPRGCKARNPLADVLLCRPLRLLDPSGLGASQRRRRMHSHMCAVVWLLVGFLLLGLARPGGGETPDVYTHSEAGDGSVSFRAEIAGVTICESSVTWNDSTPRYGRQNGYAFCGYHVAGHPLSEYGMLASFAYLPHKEKEDFRSRLLPGWEFVGSRDVVEHEDDAPVGFSHLRNGNLSAVVIRGTRMADFLDWAQDLDIWLEASLLELFAALLPGLALWPSSLLSDGIGLLSRLQHLIEPRGRDGRGRAYYAPVEAYVRRLKGPKGCSGPHCPQVVLVGHSLGGGLASIVGTRLDLPAVSICGPGIATLSRKLGVSRRDIDRHVTSIEPTNDIVPKIGTQGGSRLSVTCNEQVVHCHMPNWVMCELIEQCGHPDRHMSCSYRTL